jgi:hypothetical protein
MMPPKTILADKELLTTSGQFLSGFKWMAHIEYSFQNGSLALTAKRLKTFPYVFSDAEVIKRSPLHPRVAAQIARVPRTKAVKRFKKKSSPFCRCQSSGESRKEQKIFTESSPYCRCSHMVSRAKGKKYLLIN